MIFPRLIVRRGAEQQLFALSRMTETYRKLIVNQKAEEVITRETLRFPNLETAWVNYGFILPDGGGVYLAGIIPPFEGCIQRSYAQNRLGGDPLGHAVQWLADHSQQINPDLTAKFAALYKGHTHHQLGLTSFSGQDVNAIVEYVRDNDGIEVAIGPLSWIEREPREGPENQGGMKWP